MKMQEGEQYFVNRITFLGNTTTRDNVIRREIRLLENGVFNTEALKFSVKRINQLGYFKQIEEGSDVVKVEKTPGEKNKVNVTLKFEEQNRNQLTFGAGVSQYRGLLRTAGVPDVELPGPWRKRDLFGAGRRAREELPVRLHRAVPVRPAHHGGLRRVLARDSLLLLLHAGVDRLQHRHGLSGGQLLAHVLQLPAGTVAREGHQRGVPRLRKSSGATRSWPMRCSSARAASG